ncbi:hypothetical protein Tco_0789845, partial [Tanacetum coccineum]
GTVIAKETNVISIADSEESRSKMLLKQSDIMVLEKKVNIKPVNYAVLNQLSEDFDMNTSVDVNSSVAMNDSMNYVGKCNKCLELEAELIKQQNMKLKGKDLCDNDTLVSNTTTIALGMYKLDPVTLAHKDKNNREAHIYYLKHTMEQAAILREIVEQDKSLNPLDSASYSACKYVKLIQELIGYVRDTCPDIHKPSEKLVSITPINKKKIVSSMFDARHELCFLEFVSDMNACSKSKSVKKAKKKEEWKPTGKVFTKIGYNWRPTGRTFTLVRNACPLTRITSTNEVPFREPIPLELLHDKKPDLSYLHVFGALCYPNNDSENLRKLQAKDDIGPGLQLMTPATSSSGLVSNLIPQQPCNPPQRDDWDLLFQPMFDEYFNPPTIVVSLVPVAHASRVVDLADSPVSTLID